MTSIPFLSSATGNPIKTRRMIAVQSAMGVPPDEADFVEFYGNGGPLAISPQTEAPELLSLSRDPLQQLVGKLRVDNGPLSLGNADPNSKAFLRILASICGGYDYSLLASGRSRFVFSPAGASQIAALALLNDNDVLPRSRMIDILPSLATLEASPGDTLRFTSRLEIGKFDMLGLVTKTAGTGTIMPKFFGYLHDVAWAADGADKVVVVQIVSTSAKTFKAKDSAAASFGSDTYVYEVDVPVRVYNQDGVPIGEFGEQLRMLITAACQADLTNADEFTIAIRRGTFGSPSIPTRRIIPSVATQILYDGHEGRSEGGWSINWAKPDVDQEEDVGGRQSKSIIDTGDIVCTIGIDRRIVAPPAGQGLDGQKALLGATPMVVALQAENKTLLGSTNRPPRIMVVAPAAVPTGKTFDTAVGGRGRHEQLELVCGLPDAAYNFTPLGESTPISISTAFAVIVETAQTAI